jgi:hypothetical protein
MAKMNWNRPNGGYEPEPWRKSNDPGPKKITQPKPVTEHYALGHNVITAPTTKGPHKSFYKCATCDKWLAWKTK